MRDDRTMLSDWASLRRVLLTAAGVSAAAAAHGCERAATTAREVFSRREPSGCPGPQPRMQQGPDGAVPSGMESCASYITHRVEQVACVLPTDAKGTEQCSAAQRDRCKVDADCTAQSPGFCLGARNRGCECNYPCTTDADCPADQACICDGVASRCVDAYCRTDADCGDGYLCAYDRVLACHAPGDECRTNADCPKGCYDCLYDPELAVRTCVDQGDKCSEGRPFIVGGRARVATPCETTGWTGGLAACPPLDAHDQVVLAAHFTAAGLAEHASIAAFARFALELLALGAPAELVEACTRAMTDEIRHARDCFALASRYTGAPVGPGPLTMDGVLTESIDLVAVARSVIAEACVGETLAAVSAAVAAEAAHDPEVRRILAGIAEDELRHAELGWRFLRWALDHASADERRAIVLALHDAAVVVRDPDDAPPSGSGALVAHGHLRPATLQRLRHDARHELVVPIVHALVARAEPRA